MTRCGFLILLCCLTFFACGNDDTNFIQKSYPSDSIKNVISEIGDTISYLSLSQKRFDFGKISRKKTPVIHLVFEVTNLGKLPLVILKADVSCGCMEVIYPKQPILPGKKSKITINIDTKTQDGAYNKTVFIVSNAYNNIELIRIVGEINK